MDPAGESGSEQEGSSGENGEQDRAGLFQVRPLLHHLGEGPSLRLPGHGFQVPSPALGRGPGRLGPALPALPAQAWPGSTRRGL